MAWAPGRRSTPPSIGEPILFGSAPGCWALSSPTSHPRYLELLTAASADDTVWTKEFQVGWPGPPEAVRILSSALEAAWQADLDPVGRLGDRDIPRFGTTPPVREATGLIDAMALYAGTSVGALTEVGDAASIIDELIGDR